MATTHRQLIQGLAVLVLLIGGTFCAEAQDEKIYPGSLCVEEGFGAPVVGERPVFRFRGDVCNFFTEPDVTVICPIVRDRTGRALNSARVTLEEGNPDRNAACRLFSLDIARFPRTVEAPITRQPAPTGITTIEFGRPENVLGSYFLRCILPSSTCLLFYTVNEQD